MCGCESERLWHVPKLSSKCEIQSAQLKKGNIAKFTQSTPEGEQAGSFLEGFAWGGVETEGAMEAERIAVGGGASLDPVVDR